MKRCPECRRDYYDDTLLYCLDDGNALLEGPATASGGDEPATAILHSTAAPGEAPTRAQIHTTEQTAILSTGAEAEPRGSVGGLSEKHSFSANRAAKPLIVAAVAVVVLVGGFFGYKYLLPTKQIESIAVMPFLNESGNADVEYLSDGMTETLIKSLSQLPNLSVKARSSVFRYKGKGTDSKTIAAELGVQAILNGRVVQRGDQLTLSLELIDAVRENVLWTEQYNRKQSDLVALQTEIAKDVVSQLRAKLSGADEAKITKTATTNPEAYQLYLKGRYYWNKRSEENLLKAIEQFKAAAERDPDYALAYSGLADCYAVSPYYSNMPAGDPIPQAKAYAVRAVAIDDQLSEVHASMAYVNQAEWNWAAAERSYLRAIELNPNYPTAQLWYARLELRLGRAKEGLARLKLAQQLEPFSLVIADNLIGAYLRQGDLESAYTENKRLIELDPNYAPGHWTINLVLIKRGNTNEALIEARKAAELDNRTNRTLAALVFALAATGQKAEANEVVKQLEARYAMRAADGTDIAAAYGGLGDKDEAFKWLEVAFKDHSMLLGDIDAGPLFFPLRDDPRYKDLLKRMGLPE